MNHRNRAGYRYLLGSVLGALVWAGSAQAGTITGVTVSALDSSGNVLASGSAFSGSDDFSDGFSLSNVFFNLSPVVNYADVVNWQITLAGTFDKAFQVTSAVVSGKYALDLQVAGGTTVTVKFPFTDGLDGSVATTPTFTFAANDLTATAGTSSPLSELNLSLTANEITPVPIPATAWLFGSGLVGLLALRRRFDKSGGTPALPA